MTHVVGQVERSRFKTPFMSACCLLSRRTVQRVERTCQGKAAFRNARRNVIRGIPASSAISFAVTSFAAATISLSYLAEMFTLHPSSIKTNKGTLTPSSRRRLLRHHRHFLCRRLRLPLRLLPRRAVVERGHRQTDQKGLSRGILDVFWSCPMVRLVTRGKRGHSEYHAGGTVRTRARSSILVCGFGTAAG